MEFSDKIFPILMMRGITLYPKTVISFDVGREKSISAVKTALDGDRLIFLSAQKDIKEDDPTPEDIYETGCVAVIRQVVKAPKGGLRATVEGLYRAKIREVYHLNSYYSAKLDEISDLPVNTDKLQTEAIVRAAQDAFDIYADIVDRVPPDVVLTVLDATEPGFLADYIANNCNFKLEQKQQILETLDPCKRLEYVVEMLYKENQILMLESEIHEKVHEAMDQNQKEYYIREQIKQLHAQLGTSDDPIEESQEYRDKVAALPINDESKEKLLREVDKFSKMPTGSHDAAALRTYLDTVISLPWGVKTKEQIDVKRSRKILESNHYGLDKVKEHILEFIAVRQLSKSVTGHIICLVGPPGTGKTSIASSIAKALNRNFARISLGGVKDESEIRGHRKTYIAAMPGRIVGAVAQAKSMNPLILFDEVDKLCSDFRGDPSSALLEVLDAEQNSTFRDNYLEIPFDLSDVVFIATANNPDTIPAALKDRMEIIELTSYTAEEKLHIAKEYLIPKQVKKHGLTQRIARFDTSATELLISGYTREAGVRELERKIAALCRKAAMAVASGDVKSMTFTSKNLYDYLGPAKYLDDILLKGDNIGVANGLAWTAVGGEMLQIEVNIMAGEGKIELTGSLGDVMKESARAAISYLRSNAEALGITPDFYKKNDIHIHVPDGATPKDGPSAGITITSAIYSALTNRPFKGNVAMTGEITIRGRVLPIGGLKEKSMAAYKNGINTVIIPNGNYRDLYDVDDAVKNAIKFIPVTNYCEVIDLAFVEATEKNDEKDFDIDVFSSVSNKCHATIGQ